MSRRSVKKGSSGLLPPPWLSGWGSIGNLGESRAVPLRLLESRWCAEWPGGVQGSPVRVSGGVYAARICQNPLGAAAHRAGMKIQGR